MKIVQFFKTYNFHVVQIFTRLKNFEIFSNLPKLSFAKEHNLYFKIARVILSINTSFYEGKKGKTKYAF